MEEWKEYKLGDILNFRRGHDLPKTEMRAGDIPVAGSNGIIGYHDTATPVSPCITIGRSGNVGTPYIYDKCWAHNTVLYVDDFKGNNPLYLFYLLKTLPLSSFGGGSAVPTLNRNHIHPLLIHHTSDLKLQERIAKLLKSLDDKIDCNRRINDNFTLSLLLLTCFVVWLLKLRNDNLEQQAQALFKSWFVDFEPFMDGEFVESEMGMIPKGWTVGALSEIANVTMGTSPAGSSYNVTGEGDVFYQGRAEFGFRFPTRNMYTTEAKRFAEIDSILLSVRAPVGDINVAEERCCIGRGLASVQSKDGNDSFMLYLLQYLRPVFDRFNGEGTVFGCINKKALEDLLVIIPDKKTMGGFDDVCNKIDGQIKTLDQESRRLAQLRDTLLPRLMSGELKVNELETIKQ